MGHHDINYKGNKVQTLTASKKHLLDKASEPYNGNSEGPYKRVADKMDGVFRKETINYKIQNGPFEIITFFYNSHAEENKTNPIWPWMEGVNTMPINISYDSSQFEVVGNMYEGIKKK